MDGQIKGRSKMCYTSLLCLHDVEASYVIDVVLLLTRYILSCFDSTAPPSLQWGSLHITCSPVSWFVSHDWDEVTASTSLPPPLPPPLPPWQPLCSPCAILTRWTDSPRHVGTEASVAITTLLIDTSVAKRLRMKRDWRYFKQVSQNVTFLVCCPVLRHHPHDTPWVLK